MLSEYGALTSGEIRDNLATLYDRAVEFLQTPQGIAAIVAFVLLVSFLTRDRHK